MAFDKTLIKQRFAAHLDKYNLLSSVQREICVHLSQKISELIPQNQIKKALEIGIGTGFLTSHLMEIFPNSQWYLNDLTPKAEEFTSRYTQDKNATYHWGDAETIPLCTDLDLIASASTVQWFDSLENFIKKASAASKNGAYLALSTFGTENFWQIKNITGEGLKYYNPEQLRTILDANNYQVLYCHQHTETLHFNSALEVLHHIKSTGVNGITRQPWTRSKLRDFTQKYTALCGGDITLSYQPIIIIARKNE